MNKQRTLDKISQLFFEFAEKLGFDRKITESDTMSALLYAIGNHALKVVIDWRDRYLDMSVVRTVNGELPRNDYDPGSKRAFSVSVSHVYNMEYPGYAGERTEETMFLALNSLISMVERDPQILFAFLDNIDEHTSPEKTREYYRKNMLRRIEMLEMRYAQGELSERAYMILYDDLKRTLNNI